MCSQCRNCKPDYVEYGQGVSYTGDHYCEKTREYVMSNSDEQIQQPSKCNDFIELAVYVGKEKERVLDRESKDTFKYIN